MVRIAEVEFDDYNEGELAAHGVSAHEVMQLLENVFTVRRNKRSGAGERQLIGRTNGGRVLTVVLAPTAISDRWRPVTGWDSTASERRALDD
jgi:uncharacterized DUF497 family protein